MRRSSALFLLLTAATLWSTAGILIKSVDWSPLAIAGARSAIAACVIAVFCRPLRFTRSRSELLGAVAYASTVVLFVIANKLTTAANAILLQYTAPIYVALFAPWFLGEKATKLDWITIFVALGGMGLFFVEDLSIGNVWGNILAIVSGFSFGWLALLLRIQKHASPIQSIFWGNCLAGVIAIPAYFDAGPSHKGSAILVTMGVFQLALPYILYAKAIKEVTAMEAMLIPLIEPVLNPIWVLIFLGERPPPWCLVGGTIILGSILARALFLRRASLTTVHP
ncbi:MAG TPA: DMT family transporter [Bdellovibrionota bacterium]|nr:DMT family transporter [Bdellovibrionota bacterium]